MARTYKDMPDLLKHMTLAIFRSGDAKGGSEAERWRASFTIARARLVQYGYLKQGSESCPVEEIRLTPKGVGRNSLHQKEGASKSKKFDDMATLLEATEDPKDDEVVSEQAPPPQPPAKRVLKNNVTMEKQQQHAKDQKQRKLGVVVRAVVRKAKSAVKRAKRRK